MKKSKNKKRKLAAYQLRRRKRDEKQKKKRVEKRKTIAYYKSPGFLKELNSKRAKLGWEPITKVW